jgi:PiT family inorganic phosphate transporter
VGSELVFIIVIAAAVSLDFTNGFHDTANAMATSIATGALKPIVAVLISAALNFLGAFISISVATTIAKGIVPSSATAGADGLFVVEAALIGAITWNLITWYFTIPSSSSHALGYPLSTTQVVSGGVIGAGLGKRGGVVHWPVVGQMVTAWVIHCPRQRWSAPRLGTFLTSLAGTAR